MAALKAGVYPSLNLLTYAKFFAQCEPTRTRDTVYQHGLEIKASNISR